MSGAHSDQIAPMLAVAKKRDHRGFGSWAVRDRTRSPLVTPIIAQSPNACNLARCRPHSRFAKGFALHDQRINQQGCCPGFNELIGKFSIAIPPHSAPGT